MEKYSIEELNAENENNIILYEKSLYRAFSNTYIKTLDRIWHIDNKSRRISTAVPYDTQQILVVKLNGSGKFIAGLSINYSTNMMQLEQMGFKVDESKSKICEVLYMFSLADYIGGLSPIQVLSSKLLEIISEKGIQYIYSTCSLRRLRAYTLIGFKKIDSLIFQGEEKFLLEYDINQDSLLKGIIT